MKVNDINLWFAKDENENIVTIDKANKNNKYKCPICGSEVIPRALNSDMITSHYAHIDRSECGGETIVHWWTKNNLLKAGDVFSVFTNEEKQYLCKNILVEQEYTTPFGTYKPDVTIECYNGDIIFLEIGLTNIKKRANYIDRWKYLNKPVIEFNIRNVYDEDSFEIKISNRFKAIYYEGVNIYKNDKNYETFIKKIKASCKYEEQLRDLEWFLDDIYEYKMTKDEDKLDGIVKEVKYIEQNYTYEHALVSEDILKSKCNSVMKDVITRKDMYFKRKIEEILNEIGLRYEYKIEKFEESRLVWDRLYGNVQCSIKVYINTNLKPPELEVRNIVDEIESWCNIDEYHLEVSYEKQQICLKTIIDIGCYEDVDKLRNIFNDDIIENIQKVIDEEVFIYEMSDKGLYVTWDNHNKYYMNKISKDLIELKYKYLSSYANYRVNDGFNEVINQNDFIINNIEEDKLIKIEMKNIEFVDINDKNNKMMIDNLKKKYMDLISHIISKDEICGKIEAIFDKSVMVMYKDGYCFKFKNNNILINSDGIVYYSNLPIINLGQDFEENIEESVRVLKKFLNLENNVTIYTKEQLNILEKLKDIYINTYEKFLVTIENNKYIVKNKKYKRIASSNLDSSWKNINKQLSDEVRNYIYK